MTLEDLKTISIAIATMLIFIPVCYVSFNHSIESTNPAWEVLFILTLLGIGLNFMVVLGMIGLWVFTA